MNKKYCVILQMERGIMVIGPYMNRRLADEDAERIWLAEHHAVSFDVEAITHPGYYVPPKKEEGA